MNAALEIAGDHGPAFVDIDVKLPEFVSAVRHSDGRHRIGYENSAFGSLAPKPQTDDLRCHVDAVADQLGIEVLVIQHDAENTRLTMTERTHGVEGVGSTACAGTDGRA